MDFNPGNLVIPNWLSGATGANAFAANPANGYQPTVGDALQGIGHDMMQHYRAGPSNTSWGGSNASPSAAGGAQGLQGLMSLLAPKGQQMAPSSPSPGAALLAAPSPTIAPGPIVPPQTPTSIPGLTQSIPPTVGALAGLWR